MVTRLPWDAVNVPEHGACRDRKPENAVLAAEITARQLRGVGVNSQSRARSRRELQPHEPRDRCAQLRRRSAERRALRHKDRGGL